MVNTVGTGLNGYPSKQLKSSTETKCEWKSLTKTQLKTYWMLSNKNPPKFAELIDAKLKELNESC